ncbi:MAG: dual specificity protein phosphatase family protein [Dehalococcoidia bacterium]|nr:dual specificity protein phosphatase family protein [Dehalococcoidia bacterium]
MNRLNFSWLISGEVAGHSAPLSAEDLLYLKQRGIKALVRMAVLSKTRVTGIQVVELGFTDYHEPVPDYEAPGKEQIDRVVRFIKASVADGQPVGVSCGAGLGRTGTILACYLVSLGHSSPGAIDEVRAKRPGSIETNAQEEAVKIYGYQAGKS